MSTANEWNEGSQEVSLEKTKELVEDMRELRLTYDEAKKKSNEAYDEYKKMETLVLQTLEAAGLEKFNVPGLGTAYTIHKFNVRVPKDLGDKRLLFEYMRNRQGPDATDEMISINHQTLNAYYKQELEAAMSEGKDLKIPGLEDPVEQKSLGFRGDRK